MQSLLISLSEKLEKSFFLKSVFFSIATIITISFLGYYFGTFDQTSHIPFLKKTVDPSLYPNDHYFTLRKSHYSFFWLFFQPFYKLNILEITLFILHILVIYLSYFLIYKLAKTIFNNHLTAFISIFAFIFPHITFAGFTIFEFSLLNRTFVFPFLLLSFNFYLKKKYILAYLILGLMYNLHVISVNFVLAMFLFDSFLRWKKIGFKKIALNIIIFLIAASPVLLWKFSHSGLGFEINWHWFNTIKKSLLNNIFNLTAVSPPLFFLTLNGLSLIILFFLLRRYLLKKHFVVINNFFYAGIIILVIQVITSYLLPLTIIIQSQIIRVGVFFILFSYLLFSQFLAKLIIEKRLSNFQLFSLFISLIFSIFPIWLLFSYIKYIKQKKIENYFPLLTIFQFLLFCFIAYRLDLWRPGINIYPNKIKGYKIQSWVKNNTPKDTVFIVPPYLLGLYSLDWRVISERTPIVTLSEIGEAAFEPNYIGYWERRFNDVVPEALTKFKGNFFENISIIKKTYKSLSEEQVKHLSKKYNASYFVTEKSTRYNFPIVYEDESFYLYKIR